MPLWLNALVVLGAVLLVAYSADRLVQAASGLAARLRVSELVIGLTVVAFGTSAPELAVTLISAAGGHGDISVSNVVGSNIFNLGFILGGAALLRTIPTGPALVQRDGVVLCLAGLLLVSLVGADLQLGRADGAILLALLAAYLILLYRQRSAPDGNPVPTPTRPLARDLLMLLLALVTLTGGSHLLVSAATAGARALGVSEWVIGVTVVAIGTSAPELATTIAGVARRRFAISAGNLVGSDIFNLLGVLGVAGLVHPVTVHPMARVSLVVLLAVVTMTLLFMHTGRRLSRSEGLVMVMVAGGRWALDMSGWGW